MRRPRIIINGRHPGKAVLLIFAIFLLFWGTQKALGQAYTYQLASISNKKTVVGYLQRHTITEGETLLDICRRYGSGFNEVSLLYPRMDPWIPPVGRDLIVPTAWVLPSTRYEQVVINLAELRLYRFFPRIKMVKTYPVGIGDLGSETPEGIYRIRDKEPHPVWVVPHSMRESYDVMKIPPGPKNPLGRYWMGLSRKGYGIHGTHFPWGVGRLVSHGCVRLYPEDIVRLFEEVSIGTYVEIIYEPVKIGFGNGQVYLEVHPDVYGRVEDMERYAFERLRTKGVFDSISIEQTKAALRRQSGIPVCIGTLENKEDRPCQATPPDQSERRSFHDT
jgi:L,D-transpeptidase ErfK/SrfK